MHIRIEFVCFFFENFKILMSEFVCFFFGNSKILISKFVCAFVQNYEILISIFWKFYLIIDQCKQKMLSFNVNFCQFWLRIDNINIVYPLGNISFTFITTSSMILRMYQSNEYWNIRYVPSFASFVFFPAEQIACELSILGGPNTEEFRYIYVLLTTVVALRWFLAASLHKKHFETA